MIRFTVFLLLVQAAAPQANRRGADALRADLVRTDFAAAVRRCGVKPAYEPTIVQSNRPGIIHYDDKSHAVVIPTYASMSEDDRIKWNKDASNNALHLSPEALYNEIFGELLVAHELGHWLETMGGQNLDDWTSEYRANQFLVAFWRKHPTGSANLKRLQLALPLKPESNPIPKDWHGSVEEYFNTHRMNIVRAGGYGWIQVLQTQRALGEKPIPQFCSLVHADLG